MLSLDAIRCDEGPASVAPAPPVAQLPWLVPPTSEIRFGPLSKFTTTPQTNTTRISPLPHADYRSKCDYETATTHPTAAPELGRSAHRFDNMSDVEEEAMANDYREAVQYDGMDDLDRVPSMGGGGDIQAQLAAAATPLEFQATLETKFASYDNYCNLFHFILNSDGPVDIDVPNVRISLCHL